MHPALFTVDHATLCITIHIYLKPPLCMSTFTLNIKIVLKYWTEAIDRLNRKEKVPAFGGPIVQENFLSMQLLSVQSLKTELRQLILTFHHHISSAQLLCFSEKCREGSCFGNSRNAILRLLLSASSLKRGEQSCYNSS